MSPRSKHPNKEIEEAIKYAESKGWRIEKSRGHPWGSLLCPEKSQKGCIIRVWSTPKHPEEHARKIINAIDKCSHAKSSKKDGKEKK